MHRYTYDAESPINIAREGNGDSPTEISHTFIPDKLFIRILGTRNIEKVDYISRADFCFVRASVPFIASIYNVSIAAAENLALPGISRKYQLYSVDSRPTLSDLYGSWSKAFVDK